MNRRKLSHDWMLSADQTDTGKMGVRIKCEGNIYPMHLRHYLTITRQQISEYVKPTPPGESIMATESVDELEKLRKQALTKAFENLSNALADIEYKYPEGGEPGAAISAGKAYTKYFAEVDAAYTAQNNAYYTRECARKVLEGRLDELEHYYEAGHKVAMQHASTFEELAAAYDDHLVDRIAKLRAAIQELGDAMPEPQQPKPLEEK